MNPNIIQMKISLNYIEPEIWRRFLVESSITLHKLHEIIQVVMGWTDSHLYSFQIKKMTYEMPDPDGEDFGGMFGFGEPPKNSKKIKLRDLDLHARQKFRYTYDFGDNWEHIIAVEKIYSPTEDTMTPYCIEGQRACPPEDCGSVPGYYRILAVLKKATTEEDKELLEWVGDDYDPNKFDLLDTNTVLNPKKNAARTSSMRRT